ncbi:hypothetical protein [Salinivibrio socompensis]|uniref:hypothetical protein n=1 Tax=Salinivibrio socompensis TaxID=1510206 RepID=UPI0004B9638A
MAKKLRDFEYPLTDRVMKDEEDEKANEQGFDDIQQQSNRKTLHQLSVYGVGI